MNDTEKDLSEKKKEIIELVESLEIGDTFFFATVKNGDKVSQRLFGELYKLSFVSDILKAQIYEDINEQMGNK